jgi:hypothetical protein
MSSLELSAVQPSAAPLSLALRNIFLTLTLTICSLALTGYFWREAGYEILIVTMGWPHVLLGFLFYVGRVLRNEPGSRTSLLFLAVATLVLCAVHYHYSITGLIYLYFLFHLFRDEIFVYLQTRAGHRPGANVYAVAGVGPLILLLLLVPQQQDFRQDMRRIEFSGAQISNSAWTLISFRPIPNSLGRDFYFYLQAPHTVDLRAFTTHATTADTQHDGEVLVGDLSWPQAKDLLFLPDYGDGIAPTDSDLYALTNIPVLLTGGHRVGQTFTAGKNNLSGIWLPITRIEQPAEATRFIFHLASPPLLRYSEPLQVARDVLLVVLGLVVLFRLLPRNRRVSQLWIYLAVLAGSFAITQTVVKSSSNAGYPFPLIFQFAVVFHYWSWYVFSFDKLRTMSSSFRAAAVRSGFDSLLNWLRSVPNFALVLIVLNLASGVGTILYHQLSGTSSLR